MGKTRSRHDNKIKSTHKNKANDIGLSESKHVESHPSLNQNKSNLFIALKAVILLLLLSSVVYFTANAYKSKEKSKSTIRHNNKKGKNQNSRAKSLMTYEEYVNITKVDVVDHLHHSLVNHCKVLIFPAYICL